MRLRFERLEERQLLAGNLRPRVIDGPVLAFPGDQVTYAIEVTNLGERVRAGELRAFHSLEDAQWLSEGTTSSTPPSTNELQPDESQIFTLTGRIPEDANFAVRIEVCLRGCHVFSTVVPDHAIDPNTIGAETAGRQKGFDVEFFFGDLHRVDPVDDTNGDGIDDLFVYLVTNSDLIVNGRLTSSFQYVRHTILGSVAERTSRQSQSDIADVLETWSERPRHLRSNFLESGGTYEIGDVDGDGFDDTLVTAPRDFGNSGRVTIYFGPDFRDNFVIVGSHRPGLPGSDILFGTHAGAAGDLNGDGFDDFFVVSVLNYYTLKVFYGREFDRAVVGDLDQDAQVTLEDYSILAANFGMEEATRADGDLDGNGSVGFADFLILAAAFTQG